MGQLGQVENGLKCESLKENMGGEMGSGLVGLHLRDLLTSQALLFLGISQPWQRLFL